MSQHELDFAVAQATRESLRTIRRRGVRYRTQSAAGPDRGLGRAGGPKASSLALIVVHCFPRGGALRCVGCECRRSAILLSRPSENTPYAHVPATGHY
jgi:hypothetical protein